MPKRSKSILKTLADLIPNPDNPRTISPERLAMLRRSLEEFGDLGQIVLNRRTGKLVGGHQRLKVLPPDASITIEREHKRPTRNGTVSEGRIELEGESFRLRVVDWSARKEKQAMVAANQHGGEWDALGLDALLKSLGDGADKALMGFADGDLFITEQTRLTPLKIKPAPSMTWVLIGIPTVDFGAIAQTVQKIADRKGVLIETTYNAKNGQYEPSSEA